MTMPGARPPRPPAAGPRGKGALGALKELVGARELTANLVRRDLKVRHRGTFLGMLWSLATPLLIVALYYFVFKLVFRASPADDVARPDGNDVPFAVYFFCGLTLWNLFATSVGASTSSIIGSGYLLQKVYFPRAILPLSAVLSAVVTFGFEFAVLLVAVLVVVGPPSLLVLWVPVILAVTLVLCFGMALLLSTVTVFLRDVAHFVGVFLQVWFWGTPIIYSLGFVAERPGIVRALELNPLTGLIVSFRNVVVLDHGPDFGLLAYDAAVALAVLALGAWAFGRHQRVFSEVV